MNALLFIFREWFFRDPFVPLCMGLITFLFFGYQISHQRGKIWGIGVIRSIAQAMVLLLILILSTYALRTAFDVFAKQYGSFTSKGSISNEAWSKWVRGYGGIYSQMDLEVSPFIPVEKNETNKNNNPERPLYRKVVEYEPAGINPITKFDGRVDIRFNGPADTKDIFNVFSANSDYVYTIENNSSNPLRMDFKFPLSSETKLYSDISILMDDREVTWDIEKKAITWTTEMSPGRKSTVQIKFITWGENTYQFLVKEPREITDFHLQVLFDRRYCCLATQPENGGVEVASKRVSGTNVIDWTIERAIVAPRMSISAIQGWPYAPYHEMIITLPVTAKASTLFLTLLILTMIIYSLEIRLSHVGLIAGIFLIPPFVLMSGGIPHMGAISAGMFAAYQVRMLPVLFLLISPLVYLIYKHMPRTPKIILLILFILFGGLYPLSGLFDEQKRNALDALIQAGMIAYAFILTLIVRLSTRKKGEPEDGRQY